MDRAGIAISPRIRRAALAQHARFHRAALARFHRAATAQQARFYRAATVFAARRMRGVCALTSFLEKMLLAKSRRARGSSKTSILEKLLLSKSRRARGSKLNLFRGAATAPTPLLGIVPSPVVDGGAAARGKREREREARQHRECCVQRRPSRENFVARFCTLFASLFALRTLFGSCRSATVQPLRTDTIR